MGVLFSIYECVHLSDFMSIALGKMNDEIGFSSLLENHLKIKSLTNLEIL